MIGGRHPGIGVQVSYDDAMTWHGQRVDTAIWAQGHMIEIAPDLVLFAPQANYSDPFVRMQFLRVTPQGLEPALELLPPAS